MYHWLVKVPRDGDATLSLIIRSKDKYSRQDLKLKYRCVISGLRLELNESFALPGHYVAGSGYLLPTFRDNLSDPIFTGHVLKMGPIGCP